MSTALTEARPSNGGGEIARTNDPHEIMLALARDPQVDAEKLRTVAQVFTDLQERQRQWAREDDAARARDAHFAAKAAMQAELPVLEKDTPNPQTRSKYVDFGDIWDACCPIWAKHGFSVSFDVIPQPMGLIRLVCYLDGHGHREPYHGPDAPADTKGPQGTVNKTEVQGGQATITYLQRGLLCRAIGIGMKREDDDGNGGARRQEPPEGGAARHQTTTGRRRTVNPNSTPLIIAHIEKLERVDDNAVWRQAVLDIYRQTKAAADLDELDAYVETATRKWSEADKQDLVDAGRQARARLERPAEPPRPQPWRAGLLDAGGFPTGEFTSPAAFRDALVTLYRNTDTAIGRENLLTHNADNVGDELRQALEREPLPTKAPTTERLGAILTYQAIHPKPTKAGEPDWTNWPKLVRQEHDNVPDFELLDWLETQRVILTQAPPVARGDIVPLLIRRFDGSDSEVPEWLSDLLPAPTSPPQDISDEEWVERRISEISMIDVSVNGRLVFDTFNKTADVVNTMTRLKATKPALYVKVRAELVKKSKSLTDAGFLPTDGARS